MKTDNAIGIQLPAKVVQEGHAYGNLFIAAKYCGFKIPPLPINGEWQHGAIIPERNIHPEFVIGSDGKSYSRRNLSIFYVARDDQKKYLESCGYKNVYAIGLPIIYLEKPNIEKYKNSLLIMPIHSLPETVDNFNSLAYANYIDQIAPQFNEIALCVHSSCMKKGHWMQPFIDRGISIIEGADEKDINSLDRMAHLFCRFEYVTTNGFGSHMIYAAFFGAKVSISGPAEKFDRNSYIDVPFYKNAPEILNILEHWNQEDIIKKAYPFLYVDPHDAIQHIFWASDQLGLDMKKKPEELRKLFDWTNWHIMANRMKMLLGDKNKNRIKYIIQFIKYKILYIKGILLFHREMQIFSHLTLEEKLTLNSIAKILNENSVAIEIGSYLGASSCFISKGLKGSGKLICIDTWENQNMKYTDTDTDADERDTYAEFRNNTKKFKDKIIEIREWSYNAFEDVKKISEKCDFIFIDGDHHYEGVKKDWDIYKKLLKKDSLIAFHDTGWAEGVRRVIEDDVRAVADLVRKLPNLEVYKISDRQDSMEI